MIIFNNIAINTYNEMTLNLSKKKTMMLYYYKYVKDYILIYKEI